MPQPTWIPPPHTPLTPSVPHTASLTHPPTPSSHLHLHILEVHPDHSLLVFNSTTQTLHNLTLSQPYTTLPLQSSMTLNLIPYFSLEMLPVVNRLSGDVVVVVDPERLVSVTSVVEGVGCVRRAVLGTLCGAASTLGDIEDIIPLNQEIVDGILKQEMVDGISNQEMVDGISNQEMVDGKVKAMLYGTLAHELFQIVFQNGFINTTINSKSNTFKKIKSSKKSQRLCPEQVHEILSRHQLSIHLSRLSYSTVYEDMEKTLQTIYEWHEEKSEEMECEAVERWVESDVWGLKGSVDCIVSFDTIRGVPFELKTGGRRLGDRLQTLLYTLLTQRTFGILLYLRDKQHSRVRFEGNELVELVMVRNQLVCSLRVSMERLEVGDVEVVERVESGECFACYRRLVCSQLEDLNDIKKDFMKSILNTNTADTNNNSHTNSNTNNLNVSVDVATLNVKSGRFKYEYCCVGSLEEGFYNLKRNSRVYSSGYASGLNKIKLDRLVDGRVYRVERKSEEYNHIHLSNILTAFTSNTLLDLLSLNTCNTLNTKTIKTLDTNNTLDTNTNNTLDTNTNKTLDTNTIKTLKSLKLELNEEQYKAIIECLSRRCTLIQGYPGTGKTTLIAQLIHLLYTLGLTVLITSYTHSSIDNLVSKVRLLDVPCIKASRQITSDEYESRVVACTVLGVGCVDGRLFDYVVVDEASQVSASLSLGVLRRARRSVWVGDVYQLKPFTGLSLFALLLSTVMTNSTVKTNQSDSSVQGDRGDSKKKEIREGYEPVTLKPRTKETITGFEPVTSTLSKEKIQGSIVPLGTPKEEKEKKKKGFEHVTKEKGEVRDLIGRVSLSRQYRMNKDIMYLTNKLIYDFKLTTLSNHKMTCKGTGWLLDAKRSVVWLNTDKLPPSSSPTTNTTEVAIISTCLSELLQAGISASSIGITTYYTSQLHLLLNLPFPPSVMTALTIKTIDQFQGLQSDVIFISLVKNDVRQNRGIMDVWQRMNVALTRAKVKLVVVGRVDCLTGCWKDCYDVCNQRGWVVDL